MALQLQHISKHYDGRPVLVDVNLELAPERTLVVLGKSGSGKSTLLKIIAGLESADNGTVSLNEKDITGERPERRGIVYLFQEALLFPHLNVFENIAFGLRLRGLPPTELRQRVEQLLDELELEAHAHKEPHQLSGGQKQRVAFGRALVLRPPLLLLDEPFSSLDTETRAGMQLLFRKLASEHRLSSLFVTHDLKEALIMGDELAAITNGHLQKYESREAFVRAPETGVRLETEFWSSITGTL